ncbi:MAG: hemolysin family protein [Gemmatimonadales bacterium]
MLAKFVLVVGISLVVSFLCSIMEAVLLSVSASYVAVLQRRGDRAGDLLAGFREDLDDPIAAILTLNTIAHTVGAAMGGALALQLFGNAWVALFSAFLTLAVLIFSEIIPKTLGARHWKVLAGPVAYLLRGLVFTMKPVLIPLSLVSRLLTSKRAREPTVSRRELEVLAEIGRREGTIDQDELRVMRNVINLHTVKVGAVMTPRTDIIAVPVTAGLELAKAVMLESAHSRIPVFEESLDHIVGILRARDLWHGIQRGTGDMRSIVKPARFVPENITVEQILEEMRAERFKIAIVIDEFGGTAGLVTLEDLLEEIVGDIHEDYPEYQAPFEWLGGGSARVSGSVAIRDVNERLGLDLPEDGFTTIAGYVTQELGRIGARDDVVDVPGGRFVVVEADERRIEGLLFQPSQPSQ